MNYFEDFLSYKDLVSWKGTGTGLTLRGFCSSFVRGVVLIHIVEVVLKYGGE